MDIKIIFGGAFIVIAGALYAYFIKKHPPSPRYNWVAVVIGVLIVHIGLLLAFWGLTGQLLNPFIIVSILFFGTALAFQALAQQSLFDDLDRQTKAIRRKYRNGRDDA